MVVVKKVNPLRDIVENHAKFFKIENFLSKKKKQNKDEDFMELQDAKDVLLKEKVRNETGDERFRKNKVMMQATMEECGKRISDGGKRLKDTYKSSKGIKTVKYDPLANL